MTPANIGVIGYDRIGKRVADAIVALPDLHLAGVYENDRRRVETISNRGLPVVTHEVQRWAQSCHVVVVCQEGSPALDVPVVFGPGIQAACALFGSSDARPPARCVRIACPDALALARLLSCLPPAQRVFSSCARRAGHATELRSASVDALEPLFDLPAEDRDVQALLASLVPAVYVRRTRVPYTHSHLHHLKIDLAAHCSKEAAIEALRGAPRVRLAAGADGFPDTAHVQEYYRDLGRPRGDRPEVFVWEETVEVAGRSLFLSADVNPDAAPVPEIIDAVWRFVRPELSRIEAGQLTDEGLGLGR